MMNQKILEDFETKISRNMFREAQKSCWNIMKNMTLEFFTSDIYKQYTGKNKLLLYITKINNKLIQKEKFILKNQKLKGRKKIVYITLINYLN